MVDWNNPKNLIVLAATIFLGTASMIGFVIKMYINQKKEKNKSNKKDKNAVVVNKIVNVNLKTPDRIVTKKEFEKDKVYIKSHERDYFYYLSPIKRWRYKRKLKKKRHKFVLVRMNMINNTVIEFMVQLDYEGFIFNNNHYIFDNDNSYFLASSNIMCYDFHESLAIPVRMKEVLPQSVVDYIDEHKKALRKNTRLKIDVDGIKEVIEQSQTSSIISSINPKTLRDYLKSNFIQGLVQGAALGKVFRMILIIVIVVGVLVLFDLLIDAYDSGVFEQISNSFKKK